MVNPDGTNDMGITDEYSYSGNYSFEFSSYDEADSYDQYLISPLLVAPNGGAVQFYYRAYGNYNETFRVGYSTTNSELTSFVFENPVNVYGKSWRLSQEYEFPAGTKYFVIHYYSNYEYYLYVDNINFIASSSCLKPTNVTPHPVPGDATSISLGWTENGEATSWEICLNEDEDHPIPAPTNPFTITNLTPETTYTAKVRANCGTDASRWSEVVSFEPSAKWVVGYGSETTYQLPTRSNYCYSLSQQIYSAEELGGAASIQSIEFFNTLTACSRDLDIYLVSTNKASFADKDDWVEVSEADKYYSGTVNFAQNAWTTIQLDNAFGYDGTHNVVLVVDDNTGVADGMSTRLFLSFPAIGNQSIYYSSDYFNNDPLNPFSASSLANYKNQIRLLKGDAPSCFAPVDLTVSYSGGTTAVVSWESDASSWNLKLNGVPQNNVTNPYTLNDLEYGTVYQVQVQSDCGGGALSGWKSTSFMTNLCSDENQCSISYILRDSYGDGWDNASIDIVDVETGFTVASLTIKNGDSISGSLSLCEGRVYDFNWTSGNYDDECSFFFYDLNEEEIYCHSGDSLLPEGTFYEHTMSCSMATCIKPKQLGVVGYPTGHTAELCWNPGDPSNNTWEIAYKRLDAMDYTDSIVVHENPYVLTGLDPLTNYVVKVRTLCDESEHSKWSLEVAFKTDELCPGLKSFSISDLLPFSANLQWDARTDNFDLRYSLIDINEISGIPDSSSWLQYDNNTYQTRIGNSSNSTKTWGVKYTPSMLRNNIILRGISVYETNNNTADITIRIYSGGENAPQDLLYTEVVPATGTNGFHEIQLSQEVVFDPSSDLWIVLSEYGKYVKAACYSTEPNNQWQQANDGSWTSISLNPNLYMYGWMIRAQVTTIDMDELTWITTEDIQEHNYTINDLTPETDYIAQVRSSCGEDGNSDWSTMLFETPDLCTAPVYLNATDVTTDAATLRWTGFNDSYNVRYRTYAGYIQVGETIATTGELTQYSFDLSAYSGTGDIAIRHFNSEDLYYLDVDDIEITNAQGNQILFEDFEDEAFPNNWGNIDADGDGHVWVIQEGYEDYYDNPICHGDYCAASASYNESAYSPLYPDNWLVIPNVELGGTLTFFARSEDTFFPGETFAVYVKPAVPHPWYSFTSNTDSLTINELTPSTLYEFQVQGVCEEGLTGWSESFPFQTESTSAPGIEIRPGWNWISSNKEYNEGSITEIQQALEGTGSFAIIKSQNQFTNYENGHWYGQLTTLDNTQMYMVNAEGNAMFGFSGGIALPKNHPITLSKGWNWISFLGVDEILMTDALADIDWKNQDLIKYQNQFAQYSTSYGWVGSLTTMHPGYGYMYCSYSDDPITFTYPSIGSSKSRNAVEPTNHWTVNVHQFPTNLSMMVTVDLPSNEIMAGDYEIGAFVNGECRGASHLNDISGLNNALAFLSVSGEEGDNVYFKLYDANADYVLPETAAEKIVYSANAIYGSVETPMMLHFNGAGLNETDDYVTVFPNPTFDKVFIQGTEIHEVEVFNTLGQCLLSKEVGNANQVELSLAAYPAGVYTIKLRTVHGNVVNKMIVRH